MCGIGGAWSQNEVDQGAFIQAIKTLHHRGPDSQGIWSSDNGKISLGHTRLAIIDLEQSGHQPMKSHSGRYMISFNGEIYNYKDLKKELLSLDSSISFEGSSDTEILLCIFEYFGVSEGVKKLKGMFAAGLWDRQSEKLYLLRDRAGEKPLYYGYVNSTLYFASELKFFQSLENNLRLSPEGVNMFFAQGNVPAPYSIFKNIFKVMPGELKAFTNYNSNPSSDYYWELNEATKIDEGISFSQAATKFENLFLDSVSEQMVSDVPLGAFLSGGIDSSAVVAAMQEISSQKIQTHAIGFFEHDYDERKAAKAVANHLKTEHHEFEFSAKDAMEIIPKISKIYCEPFADSSQIPTFFLCQQTKKNVTVALSGDGGDELFGGYNRYILFNRFQSIIIKFPVSVRYLIGKLMLHASQNGIASHFLELIVTKFLNLQFSSEKLEKISLALMQSTITKMYYSLLQQWNISNWPLVDDASIDIHAIYSKLNDLSIDSFEGMRFHDYKNYLPNDILVKLDRAAMANSLETRVPFLDHRLTEFAFSLPSENLVHRNQGKLLVRNFLQKRVPKSILELPKSGFGVPIEHWLKGPLKSWAESLIFYQDPEENILNHSVIQQKWKEHLNGTHNWHHHLWSVLMLKSWAKEGNIKLRF
jgi:asparagine synthase (glutamine-hydrolysing)